MTPTIDLLKGHKNLGENMDKKFSMVSAEYALHINHIQKAREHFERECLGFVNDMTIFLDQRFEDLSSRNSVVFFQNAEKMKTSPMGHAKSFYGHSNYEIMVKLGKSKNSKWGVIGNFKTGIQFDQTENGFCWYILFHNTNELDPQIDERCEQVILRLDEEKRKTTFINFQTHKFNDLCFANIFIDAEFNHDYKAILNESLNILIASIAESEKLNQINTKTQVNKVFKLMG